MNTTEETTLEFNRAAPVVGAAIEQPPEDVVKNTPSLWQADLDTAVRYGGELTRAAIGAMRLRGDRKHVVVDTKVHMLMAGQCPAIPGWHTDGAPRRILPIVPGDTAYSPVGQGPPDLHVQEEWHDQGIAPRFHLLVTGEGCLTEFLWEPWEIAVPTVPTADLYAQVTRKVESLRGHLETNHASEVDRWFRPAPSCTVVEWDWWNLHQGILAKRREWRFLIRVTESDHHEPLPPSMLADIIRTHSTVYTPLQFGW